MSRFFLLFIFLGLLVSTSFSQTTSQQANLDSLRREIRALDQELYEVQLNLDRSKNQLKKGIFIATIGYTVTIIGGQLLGSNPDVGKTLLYVGGATGIVGTVVLVKGFNKISLKAPILPPSY
ncbi:hypothetical protein E4S40_01580 [Algoriphagus kandeliae]|uniref:Uncharacterized protein n=1 Tax=Algoriphagus kandeliae TaxID=2562278 RepID=A0A4Y9R0M5_9BACT|nr:hypothetical protein [Algoriphagus kandeliae]TFV97372.1 hypothetical protein E4S40_01580 [Algoriphagus kandeliae]